MKVAKLLLTWLCVAITQYNLVVHAFSLGVLSPVMEPSGWRSSVADPSKKSTCISNPGFTTVLLARADDSDESAGKPDPLGLNRGKYLLLLSLFLSIWIFSIPPEFRRARFCPSEECAGKK